MLGYSLVPPCSGSWLLWPAAISLSLPSSPLPSSLLPSFSLCVSLFSKQLYWHIINIKEGAYFKMYNLTYIYTKETIIPRVKRERTYLAPPKFPCAPLAIRPFYPHLSSIHDYFVFFTVLCKCNRTICILFVCFYQILLRMVCVACNNNSLLSLPGQ